MGDLQYSTMMFPVWQVAYHGSRSRPTRGEEQVFISGTAERERKKQARHGKRNSQEKSRNKRRRSGGRDRDRDRERETDAEFS